MEYHTSDYRKNLEMYWQQFNPDYTIPSGYHVHHIKPKCTFTDKNDPRIHHPRNLIALHPDDHYTIHRLRGDTRVNTEFFDYIRMQDRKLSSEHKMNISKALKGKKKKPFTTAHLLNMSKCQLGKKLSPAHIKKVADANRGTRRSEETKRRMSKAQKGLNKLNLNTRAKMSKAKTGLQWFNNGQETKMCFVGTEPMGYVLGRGVSYNKGKVK